MTKIVNRGSYRSNVNDDTHLIKENHIFFPVICYEIFYGQFISEISKKSRGLFVLSSEKFLNDSTLGRLQYNNIIKLRSIENRLPIVKSSSYGNSMALSITGSILKSSEADFSIFTVQENKSQTFYQKTHSLFYFLIIVLILLLDMVRQERY